MFKSKSLLKEASSQTAQGLGVKIRELEKELTEKVEDTKEAVGDIMDTAKFTAESLSPISQIKNYPLPALGVATLAGFATTVWFKDLWKPTLKFVVKEFEPEISAAKMIGTTLLLEIASNAIKPSFPEIAKGLSKLESVIQNRKGDPT